MVRLEDLLDDVKALGGCDYCKHDHAEREYYETAPGCVGDCLNCEVTECACNGCINYSKWAYYQE